jgi:hypothetical protein
MMVKGLYLCSTVTSLGTSFWLAECSPTDACSINEIEIKVFVYLQLSLTKCRGYIYLKNLQSLQKLVGCVMDDLGLRELCLLLLLNP